MDGTFTGWAAWHPEKGFDVAVNMLVNKSIDDAINDAKANAALDGDNRWKAARVKVLYLGANA